MKIESREFLKLSFAHSAKQWSGEKQSTIRWNWVKILETALTEVLKPDISKFWSRNSLCWSNLKDHHWHCWWWLLIQWWWRRWWWSKCWLQKDGLYDDDCDDKSGGRREQTLHQMSPASANINFYKPMKPWQIECLGFYVHQPFPFQPVHILVAYHQSSKRPFKTLIPM